MLQTLNLFQLKVVSAHLFALLIRFERNEDVLHFYPASHDRFYGPRQY